MNVLIGITGGVAVYKVCNVVRMLVGRGHSVKVIMTESAEKFIHPILFKSLTRDDVYTKDFDFREPIAHIELSDWADVLAIVPATANTVAKLAYGIADNLLLSTALACNKRRIVVPSMNTKMFESAVTQENLKRLKDLLSYEIVDPDTGMLACGYAGKGRLPSEDVIVGIIDRDPQMPLKGKTFIVTAGRTVEPIDPVRFVSNSSSGRMGFEVAKALYRYGADVRIVCGEVSVAPPEYIGRVKVDTTESMLNATQEALKDADGLFMAAAPADYRPKTIYDDKIKKTGESLTIEFEPTPDILKKRSGGVSESDDGRICAGKPRVRGECREEAGGKGAGYYRAQLRQ